MARILIVDDEESILNVMSVVLKTEDYDVVAESKGESALALVEKEEFDLLLSDIRMTPVNGMELLKRAREVRPEMPVIMLTAFSSMETATEALKLGAFDYILKPFKVDELMETIRRALEYGVSSKEKASIEAGAEVHCYMMNIIAESAAMRQTCEMVKKVAPVDTPVLILGEDGTGKKSMAEALHACSHRKDAPYFAVNCAELPEPLLDSALFGHIKNAFEGANEEKEGLIQSADKGSILLDEISAMPLSIQQKLLNFMQNKTIQKLGSKKDIEVNTRIIATSNAPLDIMVRNSQFLDTLYQRLSVIPVRIKPLRERIEDIIPLACYYIQLESKGSEVPKLEQEAGAILESYSWPGNCSELQNVIKHAVPLAKGKEITRETLPPEVASTPIHPNRHGDSEAESYRARSLKAFLASKKQEYLQHFKTSNDKNK